MCAREARKSFGGCKVFFIHFFALPVGCFRYIIKLKVILRITMSQLIKLYLCCILFLEGAFASYDVNPSYVDFYEIELGDTA